jgi:histidyl-tRNA synthetase
MAELFERSSGESSDVVQKEMYRFTDQRAEALLCVRKALLLWCAPMLKTIWKCRGKNPPLLYGPDVRYDRPQAGRYRSFINMAWSLSAATILTMMQK